MAEYRAIATTAEEQSAPNDTVPDPGETPAYMTLAAQYGLTDDDMEIVNTTPEQTVEQEFQAYVTALLSPNNIDILKFWEVSSRLDIYIPITN